MNVLDELNRIASDVACTSPDLGERLREVRRRYEGLLQQNRWLKAHRQCPECKHLPGLPPWVATTDSGPPG